MKRSDMLYILKDALSMSTAGLYLSEDSADEVLAALEKAGMLPPYHMEQNNCTKGPKSSSVDENLYCCHGHFYYPQGFPKSGWEPEDG